VTGIHQASQAPSTVLVTVQGPDERAELQLPADWPVGELLPGLVEICALAAHSAGARWELAPLGGLAYDPSRTLREVGVMDGSLLHLRDVAAPPAGFAEPDPDSAAAAPPYPAYPPPEPPPPQPAYEDTSHPPHPALPQPPPRAALPVPVAAAVPPLPQDRTRWVLPARIGLVDRIGAALDAALQSAPPAPAAPAAQPRPGEIVDPQRLVVRRAPGRLERVRWSWRSTDYLTRLDEAIAAPQLRRCATIAVMSPKGGVGKTTTTTLLGCLLALLRPDRVVAIDTNPDFGSLGRQLAPGHSVFVDDLHEVLDEPELTATALDNHLGRAAHGLMVLPAPTDPVRVSRLDSDAYARVVRRLQQMVGVIVLDTGTGLHEPAARAALATADQVVLVSDSEPSTASLVAEAAAHLGQGGLPIWLLLNKAGVPTELDLRAFGAAIPHARGLVEVGNEVAAARRVAAGRFTWADAPGSWRRSVRELAAALVADWAGLGVAG
jgi:MinD-like ATPase involved in chromosome partitioning or flagellar assembly